MSTTVSDPPSAPLAPSEIILLNGEQFAKKARIGNLDLLHAEASVSAEQLAQAMLAAAILANEQAGAIRLDVREKKALLGFRKVSRLYAVPDQASPSWPPGCLEAEVRPLSEQLLAGVEGNEVSSVIVAWLKQDSANPWQSAIELVKAGLASRYLLDAVEEKRLKVFSTTRYELPDATATLIAQQPIEPVQQLLRSCQDNQPGKWNLLQNEIRSAIKARTEQNDGGPGIDI
jgi:hypothetical protein